MSIMKDKIIYPIRCKTTLQGRYYCIRDYIRYDSLFLNTIRSRIRIGGEIIVPIYNDRNINHTVCYTFGELKQYRVKKSGLRTAMNKPENKRNVLRIAKQRVKNQTNAIRYHLVANLNQSYKIEHIRR